MLCMTCSGWYVMWFWEWVCWKIKTLCHSFFLIKFWSNYWVCLCFSICPHAFFSLFNGKEKETLFWRVLCKHKWANSQREPIGHSSPTYRWNKTSHLFSCLFLCLCFDFFWKQVKRNALSCVWFFILTKRTKIKC